jgi:hypothetical protein
MGVGGQRHSPAALPWERELVPIYRRLGGPQSLSGRMRKISPTPGFDPRCVQPVANRYPGPPKGLITLALRHLSLGVSTRGTFTREV